MSTIKDGVLDLVKDLPDDVDFEDIIEAIIVRQKVLKGIKDSETGNFVSHEEARSVLEKRLKSDG
jgi:predicted transcriptional regulator